MAVLVRRPGNVMIRIPGWAPDSSLELTVDGKPLPLRRRSVFAWIPAEALHAGSEIAFCYALPERCTEEGMPSGRRYRLAAMPGIIARRSGTG